MIYSQTFPEDDINQMNCTLKSISTISQDDDAALILDYLHESYRVENNFAFKFRELDYLYYRIINKANLLIIGSGRLDIIKKIYSFTKDQIDASNKFTINYRLKENNFEALLFAEIILSKQAKQKIISEKEKEKEKKQSNSKRASSTSGWEPNDINKGEKNQMKYLNMDNGEVSPNRLHICIRNNKKILVISGIIAIAVGIIVYKKLGHS